MTGMLPADPAGLRRAAMANNVNPDTGLATDYLNHFNEVVMMIELLGDCPDCYGDIAGWQPKSYPAHFADSHFSGKDFIIAAYEQAPPQYRERFDHAVEDLNRAILDGLSRIGSVIDAGAPDALAPLVAALAADLHTRIAAAGSLINGTETATDQDMVDSVIGF